MTDVGRIRRRASLAVVSESEFTVGDHGVHTAFVEQVRALRALGANVCVNSRAACRRASLTAIHTPGPFGWACLRAAGARGVAYAHVTPATLAESLRLEPTWRPLARAYLGRFYRRAPRVVAVSREVRDELLELGVSASRLSVIPNGIDAGRFADGVSAELTARIRSGGRPDRPLVLGVGQVQPRKGIDVFIEVARAVPECDFVWVGGRPFGPLTAGGMPVDNTPVNVRFAGRVTDEELVAHFQAADVFLFPSRQENFGQVIVEAAAAGLPLVLSDLPVFREHFADGAILAPSSGELANAVRRLAADEELRADGARAARTIAGRFSAASSAEALLALVPEPAHRRRHEGEESL